MLRRWLDDSVQSLFSELIFRHADLVAIFGCLASLVRLLQKLIKRLGECSCVVQAVGPHSSLKLPRSEWLDHHGFLWGQLLALCHLGLGFLVLLSYLSLGVDCISNTTHELSPKFVHQWVGERLLRNTKEPSHDDVQRCHWNFSGCTHTKTQGLVERPHLVLSWITAIPPTSGFQS